MPPSELSPPRPDLVDHLRERIAGLEADRTEADVRWRRVAAALGLEGDPMDEVIVARAEAVRREMERRRTRIEHLRIALSDIAEDGDETARDLARTALEMDLERRVA